MYVFRQKLSLKSIQINEKNIKDDLWPQFSLIVTTADIDDRTFMEIQVLLFPLIYHFPV